MPDLRGASAEALSGLAEAIGSTYAADPTAAAKLADELVAAAATLRHEGALRRYVTDAAVPVEARTGLTGDLFSGQVGEETLALLRDAVERRWTAARDLVDALEHLAVLAHVASAGRESERLSDELFTVAQAVKGQPLLRDALSDPVRSTADKAALVDDLLAGKALPATVALAKLALAGTHRTVGAALEEYQRAAARAHGQGVATVRVARELSDADRDRLAAALERTYGRPVHLNLVVDPGVLGGVRVEIGDDVIDGTVSGRLEDARRRLAG